MAPPTNTEPAPTPFNLRGYIAGAGATAALIAGAVIVFLSAAAFVAFNGMPFGSTDETVQGTIAIASGNAPETAAARAANAGSSVSRKAVAISPAAAAEIARANGTAHTGPGASKGNSSAPTIDPVTGDTVPGTGTITDPGTTASPTTAPTIPTTPASSGTSSGIVNGVDDAASSAGVHTGLGDATSGITGQVDGAVNGVGGAAGNPDLGDQVGGAVNGATGSILGH